MLLTFENVCQKHDLQVLELGGVVGNYALKAAHVCAPAPRPGTSRSCMPTAPRKFRADVRWHSAAGPRQQRLPAPWGILRG